MLAYLVSHGATSRKNLAQEFDLSAATLTRATRPLIDHGLLDESDSPSPSGSRGRPVTLVDINPDYALFLGVKLTGDEAFAVATDARGHILTSQSLPLIDRSIDGVATVIEQLATRGALVDGIRPLAIGVTLGAAVVGTSIVRVAPFLGWENVPLGHILTERTSIPTLIANDVRAFTLAEAWSGIGKDASPFALLTLGAGIGCGIAINGTVLSGSHGGAGSVGHLPVLADGPECESGHRGCARAVASEAGIRQRSEQLLGHAWGTDDLLRIIHDAESRDSQSTHLASQILTDASRATGTIVGSLAAFLDPAMVVISGENVGIVEHFRHEFNEEVERARHWTASRVPVHLKQFSFTEWARGGATLAIDYWAHHWQDFVSEDPETKQ